MKMIGELEDGMPGVQGLRSQPEKAEAGAICSLTSVTRWRGIEKAEPSQRCTTKGPRPTNTRTIPTRYNGKDISW